MGMMVSISMVSNKGKDAGAQRAVHTPKPQFSRVQDYRKYPPRKRCKIPPVTLTIIITSTQRKY